MTTPKATGISSTAGIPVPAKKVIDELKEVLETITARRPKMQKIRPLAVGATDAEMAEKINEIIERIQP